MNSTQFGLLAKFNTAEIPLKYICVKYIGLDSKTADQRTALNKQPILTYRGGSEKSIKQVNASELAEYLDKCKLKAQHEWNQSNNLYKKQRYLSLNCGC